MLEEVTFSALHPPAGAMERAMEKAMKHVIPGTNSLTQKCRNRTFKKYRIPHFKK